MGNYLDEQRALAQRGNTTRGRDGTPAKRTPAPHGDRKARRTELAASIDKPKPKPARPAPKSPPTIGVEPTVAPAPAKPKPGDWRRTLAEVAAGGDQLATLQRLRDELAVAIDKSDSARDVAALGRLLADVLGRIDALELGPVTSEDTTIDEISRRRANRGADTDRIMGAPGGRHG